MRSAVAAVALCLPALAAGASVELSHGMEALTRDLPAWRATAVEALWTGERGAALGGAVRELSRSDRDDLELAALAQAPLRGFVVGVEGSASPSARFLPRWSAGIRVERPLPRGWVASAGARAARYDLDGGGDASPFFAIAGLERYFGRWRAAATTTAVALGGSWSAGGRGALDLYYGDGGRAGLSAGAGRELESLGDGRLLRSDVIGAAIVGAHPLRPGWAITWELSVHRQGDLYTRTGGRLGLRRRF